MASGTELAEKKKASILAVGYPGAGKTGMIAALLNAGFKVRMIDFEGNTDPIIEFTEPKFLKNFDAVLIEDEMRMGAQHMEPLGIPTAFNRALGLMNEWKYTDGKGKEINLGKSREWGSDTVLVVDSMSGLNEACMRRAMKMMNVTSGQPPVTVYNAAVDDATNFIKTVNKKSNAYNVIFLAHLTMIGPDIPMSSKSEDQDLKDMKLQMALEKAELIPTRFYPKAVTKGMSTTIHKEFPTMLLVERQVKAGKTVRVIRTQSGEEVDTKFPVRDSEKSYPIEDGLATIFEKLGVKAPKLKG